MTLTLDQIANLADTLTTAGLLLILLFGNFRGWWVSGHTHKEITDRLLDENAQLRAERDRYLAIALKANDLASDGARIATALNERGKQ